MKQAFATMQPARRSALRHLGAAVAALLLPTREALAHEGHHHPDMAAPPEGYVRRVGNYVVPDLTLRDADGMKVPLRSSLAEKPVILNFIFTTCDTICPVTSMTFLQLQEALGKDAASVRMVSVSIDPEQDTPAVLKRYGARYGAGPQWKMLTGTADESVQVQRAFDVYRGDKMNHQAATFLRIRAEQPWVRLDGFATAKDILQEFRLMQAR